jgi:NADH dehydrogenase/NADH:ubiquinone oxidoreductase subunit G
MSNIIKFAVLLIGALLIALIVRVVVASASRPANRPVTTEKVQVSAADLPQGLLLRDEDLVWKAMPANKIPPNASVSGAQDAPDIKGALLRHPIESGAVLTTADVVLPGAAYTEKAGTYVNTEGRAQVANRAAFPPGEAREDWAVLRALSEAVGHRLPFDNLSQLRAALYAAHPHLARVDHVEPGDPAALLALAGVGGTPASAPFTAAVSDFYLTNPIARASAVMAECSALAHSRLAAAAE